MKGKVATSVTVRAVVKRTDGTVEDLGIIVGGSRWDRIKQFIRRCKKWRTW